MSIRSRWFIPALIAGVVVLAALLSSAIFLWGAYVQHWEGSGVVKVAKALPIPAARLGSRSILLRDYLAAVHSVELYLSSPEAAQQQIQRPLTDDDRKNALERLMHEMALEELAEKRSIQVTDQQIQAIFTELNVTSTSTEAFSIFLKQQYDWTMDDFTTHVARPLVLTRLLAASYAVDHAGDPTALEQYFVDRLSQPDAVRYVKF